MRRLWLFFTLSLALVSSVGFAQRRMQEFKEKDDQDPKTFQKSQMRAFKENTAIAIKTEEPFPWKMLGLAVMVMAIGAAVGWRYYQETAEELSAKRVAAEGTTRASKSTSGSRAKASRAKQVEEEEEDQEDESDEDGAPGDTSDA